jgi:hypothetical protein
MAAFYLDEDVPEALGALLVALGHTATTARAANRKGLPDYAQLWHAALHGWVFITLNRKDYVLLHGAWLLWGVAQQHPGISWQAADDVAAHSLPGTGSLQPGGSARSGPTVDH